MYPDYRERSTRRLVKFTSSDKPYPYTRRHWWSHHEEPMRILPYASRYGLRHKQMFLKALDYKPRGVQALSQNEYWATPYAIADAHRAHDANVIKRAVKRSAMKSIPKRERIIDDLPLPVELQDVIHNYYV